MLLGLKTIKEAGYVWLMSNQWLSNQQCHMFFLLQEGVSLDYSKVQFKTTMWTSVNSLKREIEKPFSSTMQEKLKLITRKVELKQGKT